MSDLFMRIFKLHIDLWDNAPPIVKSIFIGAGIVALFDLFAKLP